MKSIILTLSALLYLSVGSPSQASDERTLLNQTYMSWVEATRQHDIDAWMTYLAPEVLFIPPDQGALDHHLTIKNYYLDLFADPNFALNCQQLIVKLSKSRNMAWTSGSCNASYSDANGEIVTGKSIWSKVWLKQPDGSWKCRFNTWHYVN